VKTKNANKVIRSKIQEILMNNYYKNDFDVAAVDDISLTEEEVLKRQRERRLMYRFPISDIIVKD